MKTTTHATPAVLLFAAALCLMSILRGPATARAADEVPANPQQVVHRILGLFAPDLEADLRTAIKAIPGVELVSLDFDYAEGTFRYDPAVAFVDTPPERIVERFNELLRNRSRQMFGIGALGTIPRDKLTRVEIKIVAIDCKACCLGAYEILARQDGVAQATVTLKDGRASVLIDPSKTSREKLEMALKEREVTLE